MFVEIEEWIKHSSEKYIQVDACENRNSLEIYFEDLLGIENPDACETARPEDVGWWQWG